MSGKLEVNKDTGKVDEDVGEADNVDGGGWTTHKLPRAKMPQSAILLLFGDCNVLTTRVGIKMTTKSLPILNAALANQNAVRSMHVP